MSNTYFNFKQFTINQGKCAFKVGTDGVLLGACADVTGKKKILDIGTGTGLIALMLAQKCDAEIVALEPDFDSFIQAAENIAHCKWHSRIKIEKCLLQDYYPDNAGFDLIVTNPPYFIDSLKNPDPARSATRHTVTLTHSDILTGAGRLLGEEGIFQLILPFAEGNVFIAEAQGYGFYCNKILKIKSTPKSKIRRLILGFSRKKSKPAEKFLTIEKGIRHDFTEEYVALVKDFYLKL
jgi:tRNA1Val (adenine37-N6)-methyltransferase